jgi:hypothetical protein
MWRLTDLHTATETENKMKGRLLLDVVVRKSAAVLKLLACEDQALLVRRNAFLVLDLGLNIVDGVGRLDLESDGLAGDCGNMLAGAWVEVAMTPRGDKGGENLRVFTKICILTML